MGEKLRLSARQTTAASQARRLLALASIYDGGWRTDAARLGGVPLQIMRDWRVRRNARGLDRLTRKGGHLADSFCRRLEP